MVNFENPKNYSEEFLNELLIFLNNTVGSCKSMGIDSSELFDEIFYIYLTYHDTKQDGMRLLAGTFNIMRDLKKVLSNFQTECNFLKKNL